MDKRRAFYFSTVIIIMVTVCALTAAAQDVIYITEPDLAETPKILPRMDAPLWNMDYRHNPALLKLDRPYEFIDDAYYLGSGWSVSSESFNEGFTYNGLRPGFLTKHVEDKYLTTVLGTDAGFALRLNDRSNLAVIFTYRYGNTKGDGNFFLISSGPTFTAREDGSISQKLETHDFTLSVLYSLEMSNAVAVGAGFKYTYRDESWDSDIFGRGFDDSFITPSSFLTDLNQDLGLGYSIVSPVLGVSLKPSDRFNMDAWLSAGFYFGDVRKNSNLFENASGTNPAYSEDLDSSDLTGWDISASVRPELAVTSTLSIPFVLDFSYRDVKWSVGGASFGGFFPYDYDLIFHTPGHITYKNEETTWHAKVGAGLTYDAGWATLSGLLSYTRWEFLNAYDQHNYFIISLPTAYAQRDMESRDIVALDLSLRKDFSTMLSADFSATYLVGWAHRRYQLTYRSPWESILSRDQLKVVADGRDAYQDLILSATMNLKPTERLSLSLMGTVTIPVNGLDYTLHGLGTGLNIANGMGTRDVQIDGPVVREYESSGWEWGALLSLTYEFGCPVPTPPPAPPAPVIEPKIEPMSFK
jgi:hypothetical protein